jgi:hypothetical protein
MICVRCTKNNAPSGIYLCPLCKVRPHFDKQKVDKGIIEAFDKLPQAKQTEILFLVNERLKSLIDIVRLCDFNLNELMRDYTWMATAKSPKVRELKMRPPKTDDSVYDQISYDQYTSPK